jgi:hypothetical protein
MDAVSRKFQLHMNKDFAPLLLGKDLRSIARSNEVARFVDDQESFDLLFNFLLHHERLLVMRAADAVEKITTSRPEFLEPHKNQLLTLLRSSVHKELQWHLALLIYRIDLTPAEVREVWSILSYWTQNPNESKIVRVNSLQGLFELSLKYVDFKPSFDNILATIEHEAIPSLQARIKKIKGRQAKRNVTRKTRD